MTDKISSEDFIKAFGGGVKHKQALTEQYLKRPQGDLISREALKQAIEPYRYAICGFEGILALIDNAPTVPQINIFCENADETAIEDMKAELQSVIEPRPQGDCISRELLKKDIDAQISDFNELNKKGEPYKEFKDIRAILFGLFIGKNLIDNAMSMNYTFLPQYQVDLQCAYDCGYEKGKQDRPQGEWIHRDAHWDTCSNCGLGFRDLCLDGFRFCPNCGAQMKGSK